jgi:hypothetical protein
MRSTLATYPATIGLGNNLREKIPGLTNNQTGTNAHGDARGRI